MVRAVRRTTGSDGRIRYAGWKIQPTREWAGATVEVIDSGDKVPVVFGDELITSFSTEEPRGYIGTGVLRGKRCIPRRMER